MTIFDALRYPISMPPTAEELLAVPTKVYKKWIQSSDWKQIASAEIDRGLVSGWYTHSWPYIQANPADHEKDFQDLANLRRMLLEHDV